ncbi:MAG: low molecular weight phosphotyrosine protein phosphatase [Acaryochloridaceae cyanobacterium RL_2_7]|nr:low molecular weight phosphotyrosine protein phosphatase [Acaryochloridaceae cyanobacterium RL_2_7]
MPTKLLFVCLGNICRSPSAENIMNHLIQEAGLGHQIQCDSAGTSGYHIGEPPDRRMNQAAMAKGLKLVGSSRRFESTDFEVFDLILAMDRANYRDLVRQDAQGKYRDKIKMMCDYCSDFTDKEVPDPYYGGADGFNYVIDLLFDACDGLLKDLDLE